MPNESRERRSIVVDPISNCDTVLLMHYALLKADTLQRVPEGVNSGFSSAAHAHS
jgi:hypothetical protein